MIWPIDFLTRVPRPFNRERTVFSKNGAGTTGYPRAKERSRRNSLAVKWLGLSAFTALARVQSLVAELRSHKPPGAAKKQKQKEVGFLPNTIYKN